MSSRTDYSVVGVPQSVRSSDLSSRTTHPVVAVSESEGYVAVSDELRQALEREGVHGLRFEEPTFAAASSKRAPPNKALQRTINSWVQSARNAAWRHAGLTESGPVRAVAGR